MRRLTIAIALVLVAGCGGNADSGGRSVGMLIDLPAPSHSGDVSLEQTLATRRSVRHFTSDALDAAQLSQLLWSAQGVTTDAGKRTAPSAGALYPLESYVVTSEGWYRYLPDDHRLERCGVGDVRGALSDAAFGQEAVAAAPVVFLVTGVYDRTAHKYGHRAERYVHLEAGHAAQNLLLQAVAEGLGAVPIGAFDDGQIQSVLGLPADHEPLYLLPVGHPGPGGGS